MYLDLMLEVAREAGQVAMDLMGISEPSLKVDNSVVTKADRSISQLVKQRLANILSSPDHILIDEEDPQNIHYLDQNILGKTPFIWVVDPIDGTRIYANHMPHFGISLGLIKNLKPYIGVVYFPALKELFYAEDHQAYYVHRAFEKDAKKTSIKPIDQQITSQSVFFCHDSFFKKYDWDNTDCRAMIMACAVVDMCWPALGRGCGGIFQPALWDFAGSWPIAIAAGLQMWSLHSEKRLDVIHADLFKTQGKPWELKELYVVCSERNFPILKSKLIPLKNRKGVS